MSKRLQGLLLICLTVALFVTVDWALAHPPSANAYNCSGPGATCQAASFSSSSGSASLPSGNFANLRAGGIDAGVVVSPRFVATTTDAGCAVTIPTNQRLCVDTDGSPYLSFDGVNANWTGSNFIITSAGLIVNACCQSQLNGGVVIGQSTAAITSTPRGTATIDFASIAIDNCATSTVTVTGAVADNPVVLGVPNASNTTGSQFTAWVSATNTVTVKHCCVASGPCDPASGTFTARVIN